MPIEKLIGKGFSYQDVQSRLEIGGNLNILQVTEKKITGQGLEVPWSEIIVAPISGLLRQYPQATLDEVYSNALMNNLIERIQKKKDLTNPLKALAEYNSLTQQEEEVLEESTAHKM